MKGRDAMCFASAIVLFALSVSPIVDGLADRSFAWHMAQHLLMLFPVPFLVLAAHPFRILVAVVPKTLASRIVYVTRPAHIVVHPAITLAAFVAVLWITHFSGLYEYSLEHPWAHVAEHAVYVTAGILFWLPVLAPPPLRPLPFPARLLYLIVALPQGALLAFALSGARSVLYPHYAAVGSYARALADQSNAAAVMWIGGGTVLFVAFLATFGAWALRESGDGRESIPGGTR